MAVINDIGNLQDIHPRNKQEVGRRLALAGLWPRLTARPTWFIAGPTFQSMAPKETSCA